MMLSSGLFHADAHPGNIMVLPKGVVGLIDYGQSKQLTDRERLLFARLVVALAECALSHCVYFCENNLLSTPYLIKREVLLQGK